jgi:hypothetical protein
MSPDDPTRPILVDPLLQRLYDYWDKERGGRLMPTRNDIDPIKMRYILAHVMLVDVLADPNRFRIRLQGTEVVWWVGSDLTGRMLEELNSTDLRALAQEWFTSVVETRTPYHTLDNKILDGFSRHFEALILPLSVHGVSVDLILGAVRCRDFHSESTYRFRSP